MHKSIQPLDYFSTESIAYIGTITHLAKWPALVRVNFMIRLIFFSEICFFLKIMFRLSHPKTTSNRPVRNPFGSANSGRAFEDTLIGCLLSKSCLPSLPGKPYLFFERPRTMSERDVEITAGTMWQVRSFLKI